MAEIDSQVGDLQKWICFPSSSLHREFDLFYLLHIDCITSFIIRVRFSLKNRKYISVQVIFVNAHSFTLLIIETLQMFVS